MSAIGDISSSLMAGSSSLQQMSGMPRGRPPEPTAEMKAKFEAKFETAAQEAGLDPEIFKDLRAQIDEAVKSARENASEGTDVKSVIDEAVNGVLKENGIDPAEFKSQMNAIFEKMGMPKPGQGGFQLGGQQPEQDSNFDLMNGLPVGTFVDAAA